MEIAIDPGIALIAITLIILGFGLFFRKFYIWLLLAPACLGTIATNNNEAIQVIFGFMFIISCIGLWTSRKNIGV